MRIAKGLATNAEAFPCCGQFVAFSQQIKHLFVFVVEGALKFTLQPPSPSYAGNGTDAKLEWDYMGKQAELLGIFFSVKGTPGAPGDSFKLMLFKAANGSVTPSTNMPAAYKGRVRIEGRATLIIENVSPQDNTLFECKLRAKSGGEVPSIVQLRVTGVCNVRYHFTRINNYGYRQWKNFRKNCSTMGTCGLMLIFIPFD